MLISVSQAQKMIAEAISRHAIAETERVALSNAQQRVLAEGIVSQQDLPAFDKALMDGYAFHASARDENDGQSYQVIAEITAGHLPTQALQPGQAARIMTGAQLPSGATAVVPFEESVFNEAANTVAFPGVTISPGKHILKKGALQQNGDVILKSNTILQPQQIAILAELGHAMPLVYQRPTVAVLATGDELVPFDQTPEAGQIRNSNAIMLAAQIEHAGGEPVMLGIGRDNETHLRSLMAAGLESDMLLLSGGVSAGTKDLVPGILTELGVKEIFHKVRLKPGKPCWFGLLDADHSPKTTRKSTFVFGLPGNPVSSFVCFELFARSVVESLGQIPPTKLLQSKKASLQQTHIAENDRPTYHPGTLSCTENGWEVHILPWKGSADLNGLREANVLVFIPEEPKTYAPGERVDIIPLLITN